VKIDILSWRKPSENGKADQITTQKFIEYAIKQGCFIRLFSLDICAKRLLPTIEKDCVESSANRGITRFILKAPLWMIPFNCFFGLIFLRPIQVAMTSNFFISRAFSKFLKESGCGDILYCHTFRPSLWLNLRSDEYSYKRKCLALQISHTTNYQRLIKFGDLPLFRKIIYGLEYWICSRFEPDICNAFDAVNLINTEEAENLRSQISYQNSSTTIYSIAHGVDSIGATHSNDTPSYDFCFLANFSPATNRAALNYLLE